MTTAERAPSRAIVDTLCNAFTPDRLAVWDGALAASGTRVTVRRAPEDSFAEPGAFVDRLDELGITTVVIPTGDVGRRGTLDLAYRADEAQDIATIHSRVR